MRITIGIPVYNTENYFGQCLNSVLAQRGADLEILVVDDCSTDKTVGIIDEAMAKDSRIKVDPPHRAKRRSLFPPRDP
jgi:glycosyltransferase involved in cell wall biosynthesis